MENEAILQAFMPVELEKLHCLEGNTTGIGKKHLYNRQMSLVV